MKEYCAGFQCSELKIDRVLNTKPKVHMVGERDSSSLDRNHCKDTALVSTRVFYECEMSVKRHVIGTVRMAALSTGKVYKNTFTLHALCRQLQYSCSA